MPHTADTMRTITMTASTVTDQAAYKLCVQWHPESHRRPKVLGPRAPDSLTQGHDTYFTKDVYGKLCSTHMDANTIRDQPAAARAAKALSIITMNITSWNSKIYRYVASLPHDVIFIQEHRTTLPGQLKVPKGYKMIFSLPQVTGTKKGGTPNTSGGSDAIQSKTTRPQAQPTYPIYRI